MPGWRSSNTACCASFDLPRPGMSELRGDGPNRATCAFSTSAIAGSWSLLGVFVSLVAGGGVTGVVADPAPEPAAAVAEPAPVGAAEPAALGAAEPVAEPPPPALSLLPNPP